MKAYRCNQSGNESTIFESDNVGLVGQTISNVVGIDLIDEVDGKLQATPLITSSVPRSVVIKLRGCQTEVIPVFTEV